MYNTCIETDRFEQCALVGDRVDRASLGGGSLVGQEAVGHLLFTHDQHSLVPMPFETETLTKSSSSSVFAQVLLSPQGGQADCSRWVTTCCTTIAVHVNMHDDCCTFMCM